MSAAVPPPGRPGRLRMTAYAAAQLVLAVPALVLFVLNAVFGALTVIAVGVPVLLLTIPATRWIADRHRSMAGRVLGTPIPPQYRPSRDGGIIHRLAGWAADPMTWRDMAWVVAACTVGFALALTAVLLLVLVVTGVLWWFAIEPIMRARSAMDRWLLSYGHTEVLEQRVQVLTETRAESLDHSAAELRRLERDLHDGAQARLVALSMSLGMADSLLSSDPEKARRLVSEARETTSAAIGDLRSVVRGIHPPVLADRGWSGRSVRWPWTCPSRSRCAAACPAGRRSRSSRRPTSPSPSAWPTWSSTPGPSMRGSSWRTRATCSWRASATTGEAAPTRRRGPACWG